MPRTLTDKKQSNLLRKSQLTPRQGVLEKARGAVATLRMLKPLLTPQDEETLAIMIDKELMENLKKSLIEAKTRKLEPLQNILT